MIGKRVITIIANVSADWMIAEYSKESSLSFARIKSKQDSEMLRERVNRCALALIGVRTYLEMGTLLNQVPTVVLSTNLKHPSHFKTRAKNHLFRQIIPIDLRSLVKIIEEAAVSEHGEVLVLGGSSIYLPILQTGAVDHLVITTNPDIQFERGVRLLGEGCRDETSAIDLFNRLGFELQSRLTLNEFAPRQTVLNLSKVHR